MLGGAPTGYYEIPVGGRSGVRAPAPRDRRRGSEAEERADRRSRALEDPLDIRQVPDPRFLRLEVRNPVHQTRYDVLFPAFPSRDGEFCTCADFARRSLGTCKHLEAAWIWLPDHPAPEAPVTAPTETLPEWDEVDRRLAVGSPHRLPPSLRIRYPGGALLTEFES